MTDSTDNSFEEQWQNAFDDTQLTPPESVWEKVELTLKPENIPPSKPNFGNKPYYFLGGIVMGLLGLYLWLNNAEKESQIVDKEVVKSNVIIKKEPIVSEGKTVERVAQNIKHKVRFVDVVGGDTNHGTESFVPVNTNYEVEKEETTSEITYEGKTFTDSIEMIEPLLTKNIHINIENPTIILPTDQTPYYVKPSIKPQKKSIFKNVKISVGAGVYQQ